MVTEDSFYEGTREQLRSAGRTARDRAARYAEQERTRVSEQLEQFAHAVEKAGEELRRQDQTLSAEILGRAGDSLSAVSRSMGESSVSEIVDSVRRFGRESPVAFIGGALLAGLALGRFGVASGARAERREASNGGRRGYGRSGAAADAASSPATDITPAEPSAMPHGGQP